MDRPEPAPAKAATPAFAGDGPGAPLVMPEVAPAAPVGKPVTVRKGFWVGATEVTQRQWSLIMGDNPSQFQGEERPVENVTWLEAKEFCEKLSRLENRKYRLPTEVEWEYACRAGTGGERYGDAAQVAWFKLNSGGTTREVGGREANGWGLFDTLGNVKEWCGDTYGVIPGFICVTGDPMQATIQRPVRGGCWRSPAWEVAARSRGKVGEKTRYDTVGLRVVCEG